MDRTLTANREGKESFFRFDKSSLKRVGVILRLVSIPVAFIGLILALVLPTVTIEYATYSSSTTFDANRAANFVPELILGSQALFGGGCFYYYAKMDGGPALLYTSEANSNWVLIIMFIVCLLTMVLVFFITFSKKMEKWSKLATLLYFVVGLAILASPIIFMFANDFGNTYGQNKNDIVHYFVYDSLYVHDAYGSLVSFGFLTLSAVLFAVGTNREMAGGDNRNAQE